MPNKRPHLYVSALLKSACRLLACIPGHNQGKVERGYAHVKRMVTLPPELELEKVEAIYRNGVLEVHLPRKPEVVGRRIEVKT